METAAAEPDLASGYMGHLSIRVVYQRKDRVIGEMTLGPAHMNGKGVVHGGALMSFADELGARGAVMNLAPGCATTTLESKTNFFRPAQGGVLAGESVPLHVGRRTMVWQTSIRDAGGALVAMVTQTQIVLWPEQSAATPVAVAEEPAPPPAEPAPEPPVERASIAEKRREQICDAAWKVMADKGFAASTMREIAEAAGLHVPTMYQYVRSKDELLEMVFTTYYDRMSRDLEQAKAAMPEGPAAERLASAVRATLESFDRYRRQIAMMTRETKSLRPEGRRRVYDIHHHYVEGLAAIVAHGVREGEFRETEPALIGYLIDTLCDVWPLRNFAVGRFGLERVQDEIVTLLLKGLSR